MENKKFRGKVTSNQFEAGGPFVTENRSTGPSGGDLRSVTSPLAWATLLPAPSLPLVPRHLESDAWGLGGPPRSEQPAAPGLGCHLVCVVSRWRCRNRHPSLRRSTPVLRDLSPCLYSPAKLVCLLWLLLLFLFHHVCLLLSKSVPGMQHWASRPQPASHCLSRGPCGEPQEPSHGWSAKLR